MGILEVIWDMRTNDIYRGLTSKILRYVQRHNLQYSGKKVSDREFAAVVDNGKLFCGGTKVSALIYTFNYSICNEYLRNVVPGLSHKLTVDDIKGWHERYSYGYNPSRSALSYDMEKSLQQLLDNVNAADKTSTDSVLEAAAMLYAGIVDLNPFDNNSRMVARLSINHLLVKNEMPPVAFYEEYRDELDRARSNSDIAGIATVFAKAYDRMVKDKVFE